jgi:hypothetical protein
MSFDVFVESAWNDHADRPEEVADRLANALTLLESPADAAAYVRLVVHVHGEHLGHWRAGAALLESMGRDAAWAGSVVVAGAVTRGIAVLRFAGGESAALDELSAEDRITVLATASSAFVGRNEFGPAIRAYAAASAHAEAGLPSDSPAIRALAVGGNNLAAGLEEKADRDAGETAAMVAAARGGLRYWSQCGTWLEEERALYRLARSQLQAGDGSGAARSALRCVDVCSQNEAAPLERFFGHAVLALAQRAAGDEGAFEVSRRQALDFLELVDPGDRQWCESELRELEGRP